MTASKLIAELTELQSKYGDVSVLVLSRYRTQEEWAEAKVRVGDDGEEWFFFVEPDDDEA